MNQLLLIGIITTAIMSSTFAQSTTFVNSPDNIPIAYESFGEGWPALVFIHGWSCDRSYWAGQTEPFAQHNRVVVIDLAGHGESGSGRRDWTIEAFGHDVTAIVEHLDLQSVILIGHSMGGDVIAEAARQLPGRVEGLIMVDTYKKLGAGRTPEEVQAFRKRLEANFPYSARDLVRSMFIAGSDSTLVEYIVNDMSSAPPEIALPVLESAFTYSRQMPLTLEELRLPVIAINPDNSPTDIASMKRYGVEVMIMPGVAHFLMMEDPGRFNKMLEIAIRKFAD